MSAETTSPEDAAPADPATPVAGTVATPPAPDTARRYLDAVTALLTRVRDEEAVPGGPVERAARLLAATVTEGGRIFAFGAGHSSLIAQDLVYKAGGLALVNLLTVPGTLGVDVRPATLGSALERVEGLAGTVLDQSPAAPGDLLVIISLSGRNVLPVEMAVRAREKGLKVIGVTSAAYAGHSVPANPWNSFLAEHCDVVLDNKITVGDAELSGDGIAAPFGPASTAVTSALLQATTATAAALLAAEGTEPPLLRSGNVPGGLEWNKEVFARHRERIHYQH
ncbi:SIS domain-containing protein [Streptomyces sp. NPDC004959]|uniref:SIS domain-containing protein n=1 Tax=unclassified Streptomyces TaxID=2593676 RepID=UPI001F347CEA|nr:SIS domain-containing protein [Streptomyces sp. NRRL F-5630]